jgi:hypothetical protein
MSVINLMVTGDHVVPIEPGSGSATVAVQSGGPVYYLDQPQVSPSNNQGSIASGSSSTFSIPVWIVGTAGSPAAVQVTSTTSGSSTAATTLPLLGSRVWMFGHSWLQGGGATHVDRQAATLFAGILRCDLRDLGYGGAQAALDNAWGGTQPLWVSGTSYSVSQIVNYGGTYYRCSSAVSGSTTPPNDAGHWTALATGTYGIGGWAWVLQNVVPFRGGNAGNGAPYTPGINYLPFFLTGLNDLIQHANDSGAPSTIFKEALRTHMSRVCASKVFEDSDSTVTLAGGTWQPAKLDTNKNSGSQYRPVPGNSATVTITLPNDFEGGTVGIGFTVWPLSDGLVTITAGAGLSATASFRGTLLTSSPTLSLASLAYATGKAVPARDSSNGVILRVTGLQASDASKTIVVTYSGGAGTTFSTPTAIGAITQGGTPASTTYTYERVYRTYNGDTLPSSTTSTSTGPATLNGTNYNILPAGPQWPAGVEAEVIVRTVGGTTQGVVAVLTGGPAVVNDQLMTVPGGAYTASTANPLTGGCAFDYWQIESNSPATKVAVCNIARLTAAQEASSGVTDGQFATYNTAITALASEFNDEASQVLVIDIDTPLGKNQSFYNAVGSVHPNDRGHAIVAQAAEAAIGTWAQGFPVSEQAMQSRVMRRPVSRSLLRSPTTQSVTPSQNWGASGIYTLSSSWADVDATNLLLSIDAQVGDDIEVTLSSWTGGSTSTNMLLDIITCDGNGTLINYWATGTSTAGLGGQSCWFCASTTTNAVALPVAGTATYTVQSSDISWQPGVWGLLNLKLRGIGNGRQLYCGNTGLNITMHAKNLGPRNTPGFNAS